MHTHLLPKSKSISGLVPCRSSTTYGVFKKIPLSLTGNEKEKKENDKKGNVGRTRADRDLRSRN
jgi:hypothetical protein